MFVANGKKNLNAYRSLHFEGNGCENTMISATAELPKEPPNWPIKKGELLWDAQYHGTDRYSTEVSFFWCVKEETFLTRVEPPPNRRPQTIQERRSGCPRSWR